MIHVGALPGTPTNELTLQETENLAVRGAIRDAVAAFGPGKGEVALALPATCEAIWFAIRNVKPPNSKSKVRPRPTAA